MTDLQQVRKVEIEMLDAIEASGLDADGVFKMRDGKKKLSLAAAEAAVKFADRLKMAVAAEKLRTFIKSKGPRPGSKKKKRSDVGDTETMFVSWNGQTRTRVAFADLMPLFPEASSLPLGKVSVFYEGTSKDGKSGPCKRVIITREKDPSEEERKQYEKEIAPRKKAAAAAKAARKKASDEKKAAKAAAKAAASPSS